MALSDQTQEHYRAFQRSAHAAGALDVKTKELIHLCVAITLGCEA
jgi:alkylhydroperoxidase/carboxymuconolactone decarboxylase family protein YurZ